MFLSANVLGSMEGHLLLLCYCFLCECGRWWWLFIFIAESWLYSIKNRKVHRISHHREARTSIYPHTSLYLPQRFRRSFSQARFGAPLLLLPHVIQTRLIQNFPPNKILHRRRPPLPIHQSGWWQNSPDFSLFRLVSGGEETEVKPKAVRLKVTSLLHTLGQQLFIVWEWCLFRPYNSVQSHVPVLHKHTHANTHPCLHLISSAKRKRNPTFHCNFMENFIASRSTL